MEEPSPAPDLLQRADQPGADRHRERGHGRRGEPVEEHPTVLTGEAAGRSLQSERQDPACPHTGREEVDRLDRYTPSLGPDPGGMAGGSERHNRPHSQGSPRSRPSPCGEESQGLEGESPEPCPPRQPGREVRDDRPG